MNYKLSSGNAAYFFEKRSKKIQNLVDGVIIRCYVYGIEQNKTLVSKTTNTHTGDYKMEKMFAVAGLSMLEGKTKVRFANELARAKVLEKNGHTAIRLVMLAEPMTKEAAVAALLAHADFQDADAQAVLTAYGEDEKPAKAAKAPKLTLDDMPKRDDKGHFLKRATREEMLLAKLAEMAAKAKRTKRTPEEAAAIKAKNRKLIKAVHERMQAETVADVELLDVDADDAVDLNDLGVELPGYDMLEA